MKVKNRLVAEKIMATVFWDSAQKPAIFMVKIHKLEFELVFRSFYLEISKKMTSFILDHVHFEPSSYILHFNNLETRFHGK